LFGSDTVRSVKIHSAVAVFVAHHGSVPGRGSVYRRVGCGALADYIHLEFSVDDFESLVSLSSKYISPLFDMCLYLSLFPTTPTALICIKFTEREKKKQEKWKQKSNKEQQHKNCSKHKLNI
jgi:hypothetical protein